MFFFVIFNFWGNQFWKTFSILSIFRILINKNYSTLIKIIQHFCRTYLSLTNIMIDHSIYFYDVINMFKQYSKWEIHLQILFLIKKLKYFGEWFSTPKLNQTIVSLFIHSSNYVSLHQQNNFMTKKNNKMLLH